MFRRVPIFLVLALACTQPPEVPKNRIEFDPPSSPDGGIVVRPRYVMQVKGASGPSSDTAEVANFFRNRRSMLQYCYAEHGANLDSALSGQLSVDVQLGDSGTVSKLGISNRLGRWVGSAADSAESCVLGKVGYWRFPPATSGSYSVALQFSPATPAP